MIKAVLLKPLDGDPEGTKREFSQADFDRLKAKRAVRLDKSSDAKAAPATQNKMAPEVANKADISTASFKAKGK